MKTITAIITHHNRSGPQGLPLHPAKKEKKIIQAMAVIIKNHNRSSLQ
jgi:hypothetical protein